MVAPAGAIFSACCRVCQGASTDPGPRSSPVGLTKNARLGSGVGVGDVRTVGGGIGVGVGLGLGGPAAGRRRAPDRPPALRGAPSSGEVASTPVYRAMPAPLVTDPDSSQL